MTKTPTLATALTALGVALVLAGCAAPAAAPPAEIPSDEPTQATPSTGDFVPDDDWFLAVRDAKNEIEFYATEWADNDCTVSGVIDRSNDCFSTLNSGAIRLTNADAALAGVYNIAPGSEDLVADLVDAQAAVAAGVPFAAGWTAAGCDWQVEPECEADADGIIGALLAANDAFAQWEYAE